MSNDRRAELRYILGELANDAFIDRLERWADRWSGRPSREQIYDAIFDCCSDWKKSGKGIITLAERLVPILRELYPSPSPEVEFRGKTYFNGKTYYFKDDGIYLDGVKLFPSPERKRVSRRKVEEVVAKYGKFTVEADVIRLTPPRVNMMVNDLCALLGVEEEKPSKVWCEHCTVDSEDLMFHEENPGWQFKYQTETRLCFMGIPKDWKVCPVCSAPRPDERGGGR